MEAMLAEKHGLKRGFLGDLAGGVNLNRLAMNKSYRVGLVFEVAAAAADLDVTLQQHDAASGGNSKALEICDTRYFKKVGAATSFTKVDVVGAQSQIVDSDFNGALGTLVIEVLAEDLDRDGGFDHISAVVADPGAPRIACVGYVLHEMDQKPAYEVEL